MKNEFLKYQLSNAESMRNVVTHEPRYVSFRDKAGNMVFEKQSKPRINPRFVFEFDKDGRDTQPPASEKSRYPNKVTQKKAHQK